MIDVNKYEGMDGANSSGHMQSVQGWDSLIALASTRTLILFPCLYSGNTSVPISKGLCSNAEVYFPNGVTESGHPY